MRWAVMRLALAWAALVPAAWAQASAPDAGEPGGGAAEVLAGRAAPAPAPASPLTSAPPPPAPAALAGAGLQVNAYATLGLSRLNRDGVRVRADAAATRGTGSRWSARDESRLGLQLSASVHRDVSLIWQPVLREQRNGQFRAHTDWAYVNWRLTPQWELKLGRYASPLYLVSDERLVGLGQPWVRPPPEVYGLLGNVEWLDGLWLRRNVALGDDTLRIDLYHARHRDERSDLAINHAPLTGLSLSLRNTQWTWHAMVAQSRSRLRLQQIEPLLAVLGDPALGGDPQAVADYDVRRLDPIRFASLGLRYEAGPWLAMAEWARGTSRLKGLPGSTAAYLTLGHTRGTLLLHATYGWLRGRDPGGETRFRGPAAGVADLFLVGAREAGQQRLAFGARWDLRQGWALKGQVDLIRPRSQGRGGLFIDAQGGTALPAGSRDALLYGVALEWAH